MPSSAVLTFVERYKDYFTRHNARVGSIKRMLDPLPRVALLPGLGLFGMGRTKKDARIAADIAEAAIATITDAEAIGQFESIPEADMFDMEYWSLEQAKLGTAEEKPLAGQVAVITGAAGVIGTATAKAFAAAGAEVALLDLDEAAAQAKAKSISATALAVRCDVTDAASVRAAFERVVETFGGVDIAVSNAGAAWQGQCRDLLQGARVERRGRVLVGDSGPAGLTRRVEVRCPVRQDEVAARGERVPSAWPRSRAGSSSSFDEVQDRDQQQEQPAR